jgi:hypothetical protein
MKFEKTAVAASYWKEPTGWTVMPALEIRARVTEKSMP